MMADTTVMLTTNSKILVTVDEALHDVIVVSYELESKLFQGVLLDSTKRYLPCRIDENVVSQLKTPLSECSEEDKLYFTIRQRFTYFQEKPLHLNHYIQKKSKSQKMTVRLRPRQVLCSKCKSICSENSENVSSNSVNKRKKDAIESTCSSSPIPAPILSGNRRNSQVNSSPAKLCPSFVPKLPRKNRSKILSPDYKVNGETENEFWFKSPEDEKLNSDDDDDDKRVLRKKRSVGSMEDLWDETVFEESSKKAKTTPVIKISFGTQGEGTVLKIPSKIQQATSENEDKPTNNENTKASKKAIKKAKKEAKKKTESSPPPPPPPNKEESRKHKHKVKHKKKHKSGKHDEEMKEKCLKQKLSINLRRVSSTSYEKASQNSSNESSSEEVPDFPSAPPPIDDDNQIFNDASDKTTLTVGDVVWGKMHGFPWWPGKVLNISIRTDRPSSDAHVSWYGTPTSSTMPCNKLSPFLQYFEVRYNRRKKSAGYKEAIRLAASEASANNPNKAIPDFLLVDKSVEL